MKNFTVFVLILFSAFIPGKLLADVRLPQVISDHMMFQRDAEIKVWGWADKNERVSLTFNEITKKTRAGADGKWLVIFPAMKAGGPYSLFVKGKNEITIKDILIGDLWICSGQSNMEWVLNNTNHAEQEIAKADYPDIRLITIPKNMQVSLAGDVPPARWKVCSPENVPNFSAVAYFFGRNIHTETGVPVGLISTNWGGTLVEAWTSQDYLQGVDDFDQKLLKLKNFDRESLNQQEKQALKKVISDFKLKAPGEPAVAEDWSAPEVDYSLWKEMNVPGLWEDKGLNGIDGTVWFRKEFEIPEEVAKRGINLVLGKIDDSDITWVNGVKVGETEDKYADERSYFVNPEILKEGKNVIAVRVEDTGGGGGFWSGPEFMFISTANFRQSLAGTWKYKLTGENLSFSLNPVGPNEMPSSLFNGMINPLLNFSVKGAIWYQGESNAGRAYQYRKLFPLMIDCWRSKWNQPDMPFFFVQLANWRAAASLPGNSDWAELREAQLFTMLNDKNTGMAVIIDIGEAEDIHPRNKQDVGYRLGLNALAKVYGKDIVYQGPVYKSVEFAEGKAYVSFDLNGSKLLARDKYGYLKGFAIAGDDQKFYWAKAYIAGDKVVVYSPEVKNPVSVRYGWADNPDDVNLYNTEGLPASPFRTDDWKGITFGVL